MKDVRRGRRTSRFREQDVPAARFRTTGGPDLLAHEDVADRTGRKTS